MKSFLLVVPDSAQQKLMEHLQVFGKVHLTQLKSDEANVFFADSRGERIMTLEASLGGVRHAINRLEPLAPKKGGFLGAPIKRAASSEYRDFLEKFDYASVFAAVRRVDEELATIKAQRMRLIAESDALRQWIALDTSREELGSLKSVCYSVGTISKVALNEFLDDMSRYETVYLESLGYIKEDEILLALMPNDIYAEASAYMKELGFSKLNIPFDGVAKERIDENVHSLNALNNKLLQTENELAKLADELDNLKFAEDCLATLLNRERACEKSLKSASVVWLEGYVPAENLSGLLKVIERVCGEEYYFEEADVPSDSDDVPIKLVNNPVVASFEGVTEMYSLPKYYEFDPTPIFTPFYMLFFAFMMGDIGYGLVMSIATAFALRFMHLRKGARKFITFFFWLGISTALIGLLFGSMFGFTVFAPLKSINEAGEIVRRPVLDSANGIQQMLIVSVGIGFAQVVAGLCVRGALLIRDKKYFSAIFDSLFWIITLSGAIGMILGIIGVIPSLWLEISKYGFWLSIIGLLLTQGRSAATIGGKIGTAIYAVYGITGFAGDLVSYTRLVALSLSGAYIAYSFNLMAGMIPNGIPRIIIGGAIFLIGQALNFGLAALGAYVHTCRLQYVEFFSKFFTGGGVKFEPLAVSEKFAELKEGNE